MTSEYFSSVHQCYYNVIFVKHALEQVSVKIKGMFPFISPAGSLRYHQMVINEASERLAVTQTEVPACQIISSISESIHSQNTYI